MSMVIQPLEKFFIGQGYQSVSLVGVLMGYGSKDAFEATVLSRKGENTGHSIYLTALEVKVKDSEQKFLLEVPELRDPSGTQEEPFNRIQVFRNVKPGTNILIVGYEDALSRSAGYDGSIRALVPLPLTEDTIAYCAEINLSKVLRSIYPADSLKSLN